MLTGGKERRCDRQVGMLRAGQHRVRLRVPSAPDAKKRPGQERQRGGDGAGSDQRQDDRKHRRASGYFYLQGPTLNTLLSPTKCHLSSGRKFIPLADKG